MCRNAAWLKHAGADVSFFGINKAINFQKGWIFFGMLARYSLLIWLGHLIVSDVIL